MGDLVEILKDLRVFIFTHKRYWLIPMILTFLLLGILAILGHPMAAAPFVYTIF